MADTTQQPDDLDPATRPPRDGELLVVIRGRRGDHEVDLAHTFLFPEHWGPDQMEAYAKRVQVVARDMSEPGDLPCPRCGILIDSLSMGPQVPSFGPCGCEVTKEEANAWSQEVHGYTAFSDRPRDATGDQARPNHAGYPPIRGRED